MTFSLEPLVYLIAMVLLGSQVGRLPSLRSACMCRHLPRLRKVGRTPLCAAPDATPRAIGAGSGGGVFVIITFAALSAQSRLWGVSGPVHVFTVQALGSPQPGLGSQLSRCRCSRWAARVDLGSGHVPWLLPWWHTDLGTLARTRSVKSHSNPIRLRSIRISHHVALIELCTACTMQVPVLIGFSVHACILPCATGQPCVARRCGGSTRPGFICYGLCAGRHGGLARLHHGAVVWSGAVRGGQEPHLGASSHGACRCCTSATYAALGASRCCSKEAQQIRVNRS